MKPFLALFVALGAWRRKGLPTALEAMALLAPEEDITVHLRIVGNPGTGERALLDAHAPLIERGVVELAGFHADPRPHYTAADALLVTSHYEAFSLVMLEGLTAGLPIVTTRINGAPEVVEHGVNGFIVERTAGEVARHLALLARNPALCAKMTKASRQRAALFSAQDLADRTLQVYHQALHT